MAEKEIIRQHLTFTGNVQGVGFRYRARHSAQAIGITGWVKNEWDGSVTMEAQGTKDEINKVLEMILSSRFITVTGLDRKMIPVETGELGFHVR